jgi:integrase
MTYIAARAHAHDWPDRLPAAFPARRLRIHEALALTEADLDARRGSVLVRRGKGGRRPRSRQATPAPQLAVVVRSDSQAIAI